MSASAPNVMSNLPAVISLAMRAAARTSIVSRLTATGTRPAAAFSRTTSLPSFQIDSSDSSRSNSLKTCAAAADALASSLVQIATRSDEPIETKERSTSAAPRVRRARTGYRRDQQQRRR